MAQQKERSPFQPLNSNIPYPRSQTTEKIERINEQLPILRPGL
jgi:hypothetical protein